MGFKVKIKAPVIREDIIRKQVETSTETERFFDFRNHESQLKRVRLPQDLLVYRMENFRTFTEQQTYLAKEKKPQGFFASGQENESVQQVQHDILAELARKGEGDSVVPVIDVLRTAGQREPLLITNRGVVVNGNRRLAAMRELLKEDSAAFQEFNYIYCMVLPADATAEEIVDIEASLQGRPETKLDYDWIGDAQLIKRLIGLGRTDKEVGAKLNRKPSEIRNSLLALTEADLYLRDWKKTEGEYTRVRDSEQFFKDLPDLLKGKDPQFAEASRVIAWTLHDNRDKLNDRLYAFNITIGKSAGDVLDRLSNEVGVALPQGLDDDGDDDFSVDIEGSPEEPTYQPLTSLLRSAEASDEAIECLL
jgi:transcription initiation factor IIE alpha subunit